MNVNRLLGIALTIAAMNFVTTTECKAKTVDLVLTDSTRKLQSIPAVSFRATGSGDANVITINDASTQQSVLGFGAALTEAACVNIARMPEPQRKKLIDELFDPQQLNLTVCRLCIGSSDYATEPYSYSDTASDAEVKNFSIAHDKAAVIPTAKQALATNANLLLFASPWSPPGWMKSNNSMLGGNMQRKHMDAYANYFAKFIEAYNAEGIKLHAVTVQNEVDTDQDGKMPACAWPQEYEVDFVKFHLGPTLKEKNLATRIWIIDHNYNLWGRALASLEDPELRKFVDGIAWHGYLGAADKMTMVANAHPSVGAHWTEGGPDINDPKYATDWTTWSTTFTDIMRNRARSITAWNLVLDENGKPNIGPFSCGGLVTVNSATKNVTHSGQYFALGHFSKFVKRGAVVVDSDGTVADVKHVAFRNPDGTHALVLSNAGTTAKEVNVRSGNETASVSLPPDSVVTATW
jgi:glucosylceramidase